MNALSLLLSLSLSVTPTVDQGKITYYRPATVSVWSYNGKDMVINKSVYPWRNVYMWKYTAPSMQMITKESVFLDSFDKKKAP